MIRVVHGRANRGDAARHTGGRLVVHDGDRLDAAAAIVAELLADDRRADAAAPVARYEMDVEAEAESHVAPQRGEVAGLEHQHAVAWRQRVDERRLPRAGAGRGIDDDVRRRLEDALQPIDHLPREHGELGAAVVDGRLRDRAQHAVGDVGGSGDLEEMAPAFHRWKLTTKRTKTRRGITTETQRRG